MQDSGPNRGDRRFSDLALEGVCSRQGSPETQNQQSECACVCTEREREREREREIYFKELARVMVRAGKSKICRAGQRAGDPGKS